MWEKPPSVPPLPGGRKDCVAFVAGRRLWVVGGVDEFGKGAGAIYLEEGGEGWVEGPAMHSVCLGAGVCVL